MATIVIKDKNLVPQNIKKGVTILKVTGTLEGGGSEPVLQEKTVDSSTVSQEVTSSQGYDGLSKVTVNPYTLDTKTVDPSTSQVTVNSSVDGLSSVTVTAVTSSIDQNISAGNIKKDVTILGVTGTYEPSPVQPVLQDVSVSYSQNGSYTLEASSGYDGLGTVDIDVSVASQGGDPWYIQAKKGQITDVSNCSFGGLENIPYGAAYSLAGSAITTAPQMSFNSVAEGALLGAFRDCRSMSSADVSIRIDGSIGVRAFESAFAGANINSVTVDTSVIDGEYAFQNAFGPAGLSCAITNVTFTCAEITGQNVFLNAFYSNYGGGTCSFPNLTTISGNSVFSSAFGDAHFDTLSMPNLVNLNYDWGYPLEYMLSYSNVRRFICNPIILNGSENMNPLMDATNLKDIEFSANATDNVYMLWQNQLTTPSVYNILTHLDLTVSGKEVSFASWTEWDDQAGEEVQKNLTVYDYPDGRIQTAYDAATTAGWTINNLTILAQNTLNYITTGDTDTAKLELPGVTNVNTMLQASANLKSKTDTAYYIAAGDSGNKNYLGLMTNPYSTVYGQIGDNSYNVGIVTASYNAYNTQSDILFGTRHYTSFGGNDRVYFSWDDNNGHSGSVQTYGPLNDNDYTGFIPDGSNIRIYNSDWYSLKYWEGWDSTSTGGSSKTLVHDFVPVSYTDSNSGTTYYGLWDNVENKFYTNTGITGA